MLKDISVEIIALLVGWGKGHPENHRRTAKPKPSPSSPTLLQPWPPSYAQWTLGATSVCCQPRPGSPYSICPMISPCRLVR
jgi:hypothetical protein